MHLPRFCGALGLSILLLAGPLAGLAGADPIPSDFDDDGDVDLADFAEFQTCILGSGVPQTDPVCAGARIDADEDVDLDDFEVFQGCLSGPDNPADPNCACPSGQTNCDGTCVNTASDNANCGACANACTADTTCLNGSCGACVFPFVPSRPRTAVRRAARAAGGPPCPSAPSPIGCGRRRREWLGAPARPQREADRILARHHRGRRGALTAEWTG